MIATGLHIASILAAIGRCRQSPPIEPPPNDAPGVSVIRPVCGIENHIEETLRSAFRLDYPHYEIILCAAAANDPVLPLVKRLMASHPHVPARLLIGNEIDQRQSEAEQCLQGLARRGIRLDRDGRQQRADAARLHPAHARRLAGRHRPRRFAAGRLLAGRLLGGTRMRVPQYLPGPLAVCVRMYRSRLCAGQIHALSARC